MQKEQIDVQAGLSAMMSELRNMAVPVTGLQQAAASATPAVQIPCKQSPESLAKKSGLATPRGSSRRAADRCPDHPRAKYQQIEDSEDELIAGATKGVQQQQLQQQQVGVACESAVQSDG